MRRLLASGLLLVALCISVLCWVLQQWDKPLNIPPQGLIVTVDPGQRLRSVADELDRQGVLPNPYLLLVYGRWTGLDERIKRGEYAIDSGSTAQGLLQKIVSGDVIRYSVTFPEGITLARAVGILAEQRHLTIELIGPSDPKISELVKPRLSAEGLFFPDTYQYERGSSDWQVLQRAFARMEKILATQWQSRGDSLPYETPYEALIMASIIERETGVPSEREAIAGVFVERLRKGMRLQTDPTVIYGLGTDFDGNLRRKHLQDESNPYNTYRHSGLPPSPIALPGQAAVRAALHPDASELLYFVARGDGSHHFSKTLKEHRVAVQKYQIKRSSNYRSSPMKK